jgi:capsular polysaccharide biosynthesis protein
MENSTLYIIDDRYNTFIFHWIIYMMGGFRHLKKDSEDKPIYFSFTLLYPDLKFQPFFKESLELLKGDYEFIENPEQYNFKNIIKSHGEPLLVPDKVNPETYSFLRNLFLSKINYTPPDELTEKYYITRKNSEIVSPGHHGNKVRQILNEDEIIPVLNELGFTIIHLEDYTFEEKIKLFQRAKIILSPNSGSLTFSLFANKKTKIIEILPEKIQWHDHYKNICNHLEIPYFRYTNIKTIGEPALGKIWNMNILKSSFEEYLKNI